MLVCDKVMQMKYLCNFIFLTHTMEFRKSSYLYTFK
jgi:hypothetical protein